MLLIVVDLTFTLVLLEGVHYFDVSQSNDTIKVYMDALCFYYVGFVLYTLGINI